MKYTPAEKLAGFKKVLQAVEDGASVRAAIKAVGAISRTLFFEMVDEDKALADQYARAKELGIEAKFESIEADYNEEPQRDPETGRIDPAWVNLQRLKIGSKQWELAKQMPKKFGDKLDLTSDNKALLAPVVGMVIKNELPKEQQDPQDDELDDLN